MDAHWRFLEAHADREEIQQLISKEIREGAIRVVPGPGGIRIVPQIPNSTGGNAPSLKPEGVAVTTSRLGFCARRHRKHVPNLK